MRLLLTAAILIALTLSLAACEEKTISDDSFNQIKTGMTRAEVENLLGFSGTDDTSSGTSISGAGLASGTDSSEKTYTWKAGATTVTVIFKDGKVIHKQKS